MCVLYIISMTCENIKIKKIIKIIILQNSAKYSNVLVMCFIPNKYAYVFVLYTISKWTKKICWLSFLKSKPLTPVWKSLFLVGGVVGILLFYLYKRTYFPNFMLSFSRFDIFLNIKMVCKYYYL